MAWNVALINSSKLGPHHVLFGLKKGLIGAIILLSFYADTIRFHSQIYVLSYDP